MQLRELYLQINPGGWKMMQQRDSQTGFPSVRNKILARDKNTCVYCGFAGMKEQMYVTNYDGNYNNNSENNLFTACSVCTRCMLIGSYEAVDEQDSVERLIICNELSQVQLNHLYRILLVSMSDSKLEQYEVAKTLYRSLRNRANLIDEMFGQNASDTRVFSQAVFDAGLGSHQNLRFILQNVRYLPTSHSFSREWIYWKTQLKQSISPDIHIKFMA